MTPYSKRFGVVYALLVVVAVLAGTVFGWSVAPERRVIDRPRDVPVPLAEQSLEQLQAGTQPVPEGAELPPGCGFVVQPAALVIVCPPPQG